MDPVESFKKCVAHPQVTPDSFAHIYINLAGEFPEAIGELTSLLPADAAQIVNADLAKAPMTEADWDGFMVMLPEADCDDLTIRYRQGVEAIRAYRSRK